MPMYKKRYPRRRRRYRKRTGYRKRYGLKKQLRINGSNNLIVKQKRVQNLLLTATSPIPHVEQYTFSLNDIPQASTFLELFDMYKINGIQQKITWIQNGNGLGANNPNCQVVIVKDYDGQSGASVSTWNQLLERSNAKVRNLQFGTTRNSVKTYITPKIANTIWNGAIASGYSSPKGKQWIDCGSPSVPHYSIVAGINAYQGSNPPDPGIQGSFTFQIETTYYLSFKQVR